MEKPLTIYVAYIRLEINTIILMTVLLVFLRETLQLIVLMLDCCDNLSLNETHVA